MGQLHVHVKYVCIQQCWLQMQYQMGFVGVIDVGFFMGNHSLERLLLELLILLSKKTQMKIVIYVKCCITCSLCMIWHQILWQDALVWNKLHKVLTKIHFNFSNCSKMLRNLVMKVVQSLANCQSLCICTTCSVYETKKIIKDLGLSYEKIDACPNDCMLFWKENFNLEACLNCSHSRWASNEAGVLKNMNASSMKGKKKATKILRWFI